jgi:hypothetical protein
MQPVYNYTSAKKIWANIHRKYDETGTPIQCGMQSVSINIMDISRFRFWYVMDTMTTAEYQNINTA